MNKKPHITTTLAGIQSWMQDHAHGVTFRPPANPGAIDSFEYHSGLALPESVRQTLLILDGETRKSAGMIGNWRLMPIAEIQAAWGLLNKLAEKGAFTDLAPKPSPYIRRAWWYSAWIPIVASDMGDYFCLDTDPPEPERYGQVLLFLQGRAERPLVAGSLSAWFDRILQDLESDLYSYDPEEGFNGEAFMWSSLEEKHLFDNIQGPLIANE
jgi:cell wall assembly regulator SMI1